MSGSHVAWGIGGYFVARNSYAMLLELVDIFCLFAYIFSSIFIKCHVRATGW